EQTELRRCAAFELRRGIAARDAGERIQVPDLGLSRTGSVARGPPAGAQAEHSPTCAPSIDRTRSEWDRAHRPRRGTGALPPALRRRAPAETDPRLRGRGGASHGSIPCAA